MYITHPLYPRPCAPSTSPLFSALLCHPFAPCRFLRPDCTGNHSHTLALALDILRQDSICLHRLLAAGTHNGIRSGSEPALALADTLRVGFGICILRLAWYPRVSVCRICHASCADTVSGLATNHFLRCAVRLGNSPFFSPGGLCQHSLIFLGFGNQPFLLGLLVSSPKSTLRVFSDSSPSTPFKFRVCYSNSIA